MAAERSEISEVVTQLTGKPPLENLNKHADGCAAGVATEELSESCSSGKDSIIRDAEEKESITPKKPRKLEMSGDGHPYAPENWPEQGDVWGWRTGRRIVPNGTHFQNRYLYLPYRLRMLMEEKENKGSGSSTSRKQHVFASKLAVKRYVKRYFPDADLNAFFASFSWNIPAHPSLSAPIAAIPLRQIAPQAQQAEEACNSDSGDDVKCKANNRKCPTIVLEEEEVQKYSPVMPCRICCSERDFCVYCCCILCGKTICTAYGGFSYFKCPVNANGGICGHVAHMECALECFVAGKVRSLGLDAEYYCRRCDGRSDMISHVYNLIQTCKTIDLDYEIKKILYIGASLIRGSERPLANKLLRSIDLAVSKLISGTNPADIWKVDAHSMDTENFGP